MTGAEGFLIDLCHATAHLLRQTTDQVTPGTKVYIFNAHDLRTLATFEPRRQVQKPFRGTQNGWTLQNYTRFWLSLLRYATRLQEPGRPAVSCCKLSPAQLAALDFSRTCFTSLQARRTPLTDPEWDMDASGRSHTPATPLSSSPSGRSSSADGAPAQTGRGRRRERSRPEPSARALHPDFVASVLEVNLSFVRQELWADPFDSPLLSYTAVQSLRASGSFRDAAAHAPFLSGIIHVGQLLLAAHIAARSPGTPAAPSPQDRSRLLRDECTRWLLNDSHSPLAELLHHRLYAFAAQKDQLATPWTHWSEDGETVTHRNTVLAMPDWRALVAAELRGASDGLERDLLFSPGESPLPPVRDLADSASEEAAGYSFISDRRNRLEDRFSWLATRLFSSPGLMARFGATRPPGDFVWREGGIRDYLTEVTAFRFPAQWSDLHTIPTV